MTASPDTERAEGLREQLAKAMGLEVRVSAGKPAWFRHVVVENGPKDYTHDFTNAEEELDRIMDLISQERERAAKEAVLEYRFRGMADDSIQTMIFDMQDEQRRRERAALHHQKDTLK